MPTRNGNLLAQRGAAGPLCVREAEQLVQLRACSVRGAGRELCSP